MEQLRGVDTFMALGEIPNMPLHIGGLMIYKNPGKRIYEEGRALLARQIEDHLPMLQCRLETLALDVDKPYWVRDENFNIDYHLQHVALPKPANRDALDKLAARFYATPLNKERALWEGMFIEGLDHVKGVPKGSVALVLKIHHAVADGKTAIRIFSALHSYSPEPGAALLVESMSLPRMDFSAPGLISKYLKAYIQNRTAPQRLTQNISEIGANMLASFAPALKKRAKRLFIREENHVQAKSGYKLPPRIVFNRKPDADRIIGYMSMPIPELKKLGAETGATINDIALCVVAGGLRDYLQQQNDFPEADLFSGMPISIRDKNDNSLLGNKVSFGFISLFTSMEDPRERLQAIHAATHIVKTSDPRGHGISFLQILDDLNPGVVLWAGKKIINSSAMDKMPPILNTVVTNVPGIRKPAFFCGAELIDYVALGLLVPTLTLFHTVSSLHSHVNIGFLSCSGSLTHPEAYKEALEKNWRLLRDDEKNKPVTQKKSGQPEKKAARKTVKKKVKA